MLNPSAVLIITYAAISALFINQCLAEKAAKAAPWDLFRVAGMGACLIWPLLLLAVFVTLSLRQGASLEARKRVYEKVYLSGKRIAN